MIEDIYIHEMHNPCNDEQDYIPVKSDIEGLCSICERNEAIVSITYTREWDGFKKGFCQELCMHCYSAQDYQRFLKNCITYFVNFGI